jgi:acetylglutamate synthase
VIYLTPTGGMLDPQGRVIPAVDSASDLDDLIETGVVSGGMERKLLEIDELLRSLGEHASVSITSPSSVAKELFTHKGSGTLVRRGAPIRVQNGLDGLDRGRITALLEASFGRSLDPGYLGTVGDSAVYVGGDYTAIAVVRARESGDYLDKLGISERAQGIGLGAKLWRRLRESHPALYWRSRPGNPANAWYLSRADGMHRTADWLVFWAGIEGRERIESAIADALSFGHAFGDRVSEVKGPASGSVSGSGKEAAHAG